MGDNQQDTEYHVASFIAHATATNLEAAKVVIASVSGAEIHAVSEEGKIVFTLEGESHNSIGHRIDQINLQAELLSLSPVYHQYLSETGQKQTGK